VRVIHIGKFYPPDKGGIESATKSIVEYLWDQNIPCDLVCFSSTKSSVEKGKNGTLFKFKSRLKLLSTPFSLEYLFFLMRHIHHYHVVHIHTPNPLSLFFLFCIRPYQKLIVHWHSDVINQPRAYIFYRPFEKMMLLRANSIVIGTEEYFKYSEPLQAYANKMKFISYAVNEPDVEKTPKTDEIINVLSVGRLVPYKGYEYLVQSATQFSANIKLTLIGSGPELEKLERIIKDNKLKNVEIKNHVEDITPYLQKADIFCLPSVSRAESFGISLIEAMSFGLPLITSNVEGSGMNYININGETGLVVEKTSAIALAEAVNKMALSKEMREEFSKNSFARFQKHFQHKNILPNYLEIYR